jgi:hypothetical protein
MPRSYQSKACASVLPCGPHSCPLTPPLLSLPRSKYSVMIPDSRVQQGKRRTERLRNGLSSRPEDESPASTMLPWPQVALMGDLLRPGWSPHPGCGIPTRPLRVIDAAGLSPTGLQPCRLLTRRLAVRRSTASLRFYPPTPPSLPPNPALKPSVMILNPRVQQGKRRTERLRNLPARPEGESLPPAHGPLPSRPRRPCRFRRGGGPPLYE